MNLTSKILGPALAALVLLTAAGCGGAAKTGTPAESGGPAPTETAGMAEPLQWSSAPKMTIDPAKSYQAVVETSKGTFTVDLYAKDASVTVNNFVFLAGQHYYDGVPFHRIIETYMIQTGDPTGTGGGGPGYSIPDELNNGHAYEPGILAMANAGPDTGGSQFFVCTGEDSKFLNDPQYAKYSIFGKVSSGMDVVGQIAATPVTVGSSGEKSMPTEKVTINKIEIKTGG